MEQIEKPLAILLIAAAIAFAAMNFTNAGIAAPDGDLNNAVSMEGAATNEGVNVDHMATESSDFDTPSEELDSMITIATSLIDTIMAELTDADDIQIEVTVEGDETSVEIEVQSTEE